MTRVLFHWLSSKALFFGYISAILPGWSGGHLTQLQYTPLSSLNRALPGMHNQLFSLKPTLISQHCLHLIYPPIYLHYLHLVYPPTYTCTTCISFIPPHILTLPASHLTPPTYTYTACISFIPTHIPTLPASHSSPHIYLHCLHLIYSVSPHI